MVLWEHICDYFRRDGIRFIERDGPAPSLDVEVPLTEAGLHLRVIYDERNGVVTYSIPNLDLPKRLPRNKHELRRALLVLNSCYVLGAFSESPHGRVSFEIKMVLDGNELPYEVHRRVMGTALASVDRALPWIRQVAMGALAAEEAVENVLDQSRRTDGRYSSGSMSDAYEEDDDRGHITERELEEFGRALLEGDLPPPTD